jgi:importin subunit alpha-6/7
VTSAWYILRLSCRPSAAVCDQVSIHVQVANLMSDSMEAQLDATSYFRKLLSIEKRPPIEEVVRQPNVVRRLVEFLGYDHNQKLQFEAAWALTNV